MAFDIFNAILVLLHVIYDIFSGTRHLFYNVKQYLEDTFCSPRGLKSEIEYVHRERVRLKKPLSHLVVILGNEVISIQDIVRITLWSHAAGVSYVSFYDHRGDLKKCKSALDEALMSAFQAKSHVPKTNGYKNGSVGKEFPHVMLLDMSDGKAGIVRVAQQLCKKALAKEIKPSEVDLELVHKFVINEVGVPEPELGLYCGDICSLYGFLPWHSRITEFLPLNSHHNVSVRTFMSLLRRYNKCEQRIGT